MFAKDIDEHPARLQHFDTIIVQRIESLVAGVEIELDEPLSSLDDDP